VRDALSIALPLAFAATALIAAAQTEFWPVIAVLTGIFVLVLYLTMALPERGFYLICAGEPAVVAVGISSLLPALLLQLLLLAIGMHSLGLFRSRTDMPAFLAFCALTLALYPMATFFRQMLYPVLLLGGILGVAVLFFTISGYNLKKKCAGADK